MTFNPSVVDQERCRRLLSLAYSGVKSPVPSARRQWVSNLAVDLVGIRSNICSSSNCGDAGERGGLSYRSWRLSVDECCVNVNVRVVMRASPYHTADERRFSVCRGAVLSFQRKTLIRIVERFSVLQQTELLTDLFNNLRDTSCTESTVSEDELSERSTELWKLLVVVVLLR